MSVSGSAGDRTAVSAFAAAVRVGVRDYAALHQWFAYLAGWLVRLFAQVLFFASISTEIGGADRNFLLIGNAAAVAGIEGTMVVTDLAGEMRSGTLQALLTTPRRVFVPLLGRSVHWVGNGVVTGLLVYSTVALSFGIPMSATAWAMLPILLALCAASAWTVGCVVAAVVMWWPAFKWLALNVTYLSLLTFCGVSVATSFWPSPLRFLTALVPFTPALRTLREVQTGSPVSTCLTLALLSVGIGVVWLAVAVGLVHRLALRARTSGGVPL